MDESYGGSEKAELLRCLYFGCIKAQREGKIQEAQVSETDCLVCLLPGAGLGVPYRGEVLVVRG